MKLKFDESSFLTSVFDLIPFDIYVVDVKTLKVVFVNRSLRDALGDVESQTCWQAIYGLEAPCLHCRIPALLDPEGNPNGRTEVLEHYHEGHEIWHQLNERCMSWPDGRLVKYSIAVDISALKDAQNRLAEAHAQLALRAREIEEISIIDHLTGVHTRRYLDQAIAFEIGRAARYGVSFVVALGDLDAFKSVNDSFGHPTGDRILVETAQLMKKLVRNVDMIGRWGGEEFMLIFPDTDLAHGLAAVEKLRAAIAAHDFGEVGRRSISFGVTAYVSGDLPESLFARVDAALYRAKAGGRNRLES